MTGLPSNRRHASGRRRRMSRIPTDLWRTDRVGCGATRVLAGGKRAPLPGAGAGIWRKPTRFWRTCPVGCGATQAPSGGKGAMPQAPAPEYGENRSGSGESARSSRAPPRAPGVSTGRGRPIRRILAPIWRIGPARGPGTLPAGSRPRPGARGFDRSGAPNTENLGANMESRPGPGSWYPAPGWHPVGELRPGESGFN